MVCLCWLLVVMMACVCVPGFGSACWDSSICKNLSNKGRILDCVQFCMSVIQTEIPEVGGFTVKVNDNDDLLLTIILATLASENKIPESDLNAHNDGRRSYSMEHFRWGKPAGDKMRDGKLRGHNNERRSYSMEHFRWGKPAGDKMRDGKLRGHSNERRSYSMEHFRWGKPSGRKRRPVKVFASSLEGGGSFEGSFPRQARRQLSGDEDETKGDFKGSHQNQGLLRARASSKSQGPLSLQERKDGTYRMSHFRWGSPPASKRNGSFMKPWEAKPQGQLAKLFRNIIVKDVQRII